MEKVEEKTLDLLDLKGEENESLLELETKDIPLIEVKELPSYFKGYPKNTKISYEPIKLDELEALNSSDEVEPQRAVAMLLKAIHCNTMKSEDLYFWDVMYIGIQRKLQAFGDVEGLVYRQCPKCGEYMSKRFKYTDIEFKEFAAPNLPMKLEVAGKKIECAPLTLKDFLQLDPEQGELGVYAHMIKNLNIEEALNLVKNAYGVDIKKLRFVDKQLDYGIKPFIVECTSNVKNPETGKKEQCKEKIYMEVQSPFEVVFPEDIIDGDNDFEVQYG